jgi:hypothetical protein
MKEFGCDVITIAVGSLFSQLISKCEHLQGRRVAKRQGRKLGVIQIGGWGR